jgi:uncharacterized lipoprotein YddW (UPF0748 family)
VGGALAALASLAACAPAWADPGEERAVWVTRYDYRSAGEVQEIVRTCAGLGATRILFQVRGNASTFYPSELEPWSERLGGGHPGFDPLQVAVTTAQAEGVKLEAWINVMPLWKGTGHPQDARHPYRQHPEWVVVGDDGRPQGKSEHYVCANPAREDVRAHVAAVAAEIARRYPVDAVHLDYIRYVVDLEGRDFSHDPVSLQAFGRDPAQDPAGWKAFKARQVTETVRRIRRAMRAVRRTCRLTAAVFPTRESRAKVGQDVEAWVRAELVDALYPMTYAHEPEEFARRLRESLPLGAPDGPGGPTVPVYPGVAVFRHPSGAMVKAQVEAARAAGASGLAVFCYAALAPSADQAELVERDEALRQARARALRSLWGR